MLTPKSYLISSLKHLLWVGEQRDKLVWILDLNGLSAALCDFLGLLPLKEEKSIQKEFSYLTDQMHVKHSQKTLGRLLKSRQFRRNMIGTFATDLQPVEGSASTAVSFMTIIYKISPLHCREGQREVGGRWQ